MIRISPTPSQLQSFETHINWVIVFILLIADGKIQVFIENKKEPLATATDTQAPLQIKYFGFASYDNSLARFFYNCKNDHIFEKGVLNNLSPLQAKNNMESVDFRNCTCSRFSTVNLLALDFVLSSWIHLFYTLNFHQCSDLVTKCRLHTVKEDAADYDYRDYVKVSDIANSQPDGYILRIVLFIQAERDANILLTTSNPPNFERDFVYEIGETHFSRSICNRFMLHLTKNIQHLHSFWVSLVFIGSDWWLGKRGEYNWTKLNDRNVYKCGGIAIEFHRGLRWERRKAMWFWLMWTSPEY